MTIPKRIQGLSAIDPNQPDVLLLAQVLDNLTYRTPQDVREAASELRRLHYTLEVVAAIAHQGGLVGMSEGDALIAIRRMTLEFWKKNQTNAEARAAIAKAQGENT